MVYFQTKNTTLGLYVLEGLGMENVCIFYGHLEYWTAICNILWLFDIFCVSNFGMTYQKNLATLVAMLLLKLNLRRHCVTMRKINASIFLKATF
jgi:hypothetical protein